MNLALGGLSVVSIGIGLICLPLTLIALLSVPEQVRHRRLKRAGVEVEAVCLERIRTGGIQVVHVRCSFVTEAGRTVVLMVNAPRGPVPEVGQPFTIVYDPENPRTAVARQRLHSGESRKAYIQQAVLVVLAATAAVLAVVS